MVALPSRLSACVGGWVVLFGWFSVGGWNGLDYDRLVGLATKFPLLIFDFCVALYCVAELYALPFLFCSALWLGPFVVLPYGGIWHRKVATSSLWSLESRHEIHMPFSRQVFIFCIILNEIC